MRLSEARIQNIVNDAMERLDEAGAVRFQGRISRVRTELERVALACLKLDDQIVEEARAFISRMKNPPPEGSPEYEAILLKQREDLARRKGIKG